MVGAFELVDVINVRAFEVFSEDESRRAGLTDDLPNENVLGVLFDDKAANRRAGFEMNNVIFPLVAAWGRVGGRRRQPQSRDDDSGAWRHVISPITAAGDSPFQWPSRRRQSPCCRPWRRPGSSPVPACRTSRRRR